MCLPQSLVTYSNSDGGNNRLCNGKMEIVLNSILCSYRRMGEASYRISSIGNKQNNVGYLENAPQLTPRFQIQFAIVQHLSLFGVAFLQFHHIFLQKQKSCLVVRRYAYEFNLNSNSPWNIDFHSDPIALWSCHTTILVELGNRSHRNTRCQLPYHCAKWIRLAGERPLSWLSAPSRFHDEIAMHSDWHCDD